MTCNQLKTPINKEFKRNDRTRLRSSMILSYSISKTVVAVKVVEKAIRTQVVHIGELVGIFRPLLQVKMQLILMR